MVLFFFSLQGAVLAAAFVRCKVRSLHISLSCTRSHTHITSTSHSIQTLPPRKTHQPWLCWTQCNAASTQCVFIRLPIWLHYKFKLFNIRQKRFQISCPNWSSRPKEDGGKVQKPMSFIVDLALENHNWVAEIKACETTVWNQSNTGTSVRLAQ